jgi:hypothetical protein
VLRDQPPVVLLNRVAKAARKLSRDLVKLSESGSLDGALSFLLPRVLLKARLNTSGIEVSPDLPWAFLDSRECADLISGLADCADVATGKLPVDKTAQRLGVRISVNSKALKKLKNQLSRSPRVRNVPLFVMVYGLRSLVTEAQGKLTLWNDPEGFGPRGTLPAMLSILQPHLPDAIPAKLNFRTLHRYLNSKASMPRA